MGVNIPTIILRTLLLQVSVHMRVCGLSKQALIV